TGTAPVDGDTLVFPAGSARLLNTNDLSGLQLTAIRFSGAGGGYQLYGNGVNVTNSITSTNSTGLNAIALARVTLGQDLPFTVAQNGATLVIESDVRLNGFNLACDTVGDLEISGVISGDGSLTKSSNSTLTLSGSAANTFTGDLLVNGGRLDMNKSSGLAVPNRLIVGDGPGGAHTDQARNLADNQVNEVTVNASGLWDLNGSIEVVGDLVLNAGGDIETGPTGNLRLGLGTEVTVTASLLPLQESSRISGHVELLAGTHVFTIAEGNTFPADPAELIIDADIDGLGGITKEGNGDLLLSGNNSFEAQVNVNGGELRLGHSSALGTTLSGTTVNNDASLWLQGNVQVGNESLHLNSTGRTGALNNRPALRASGPNNNWDGLVTFDIDSRIGVLTNGFLNLSRGMAGVGSLLKEDAGTLRFSGSDLSGFAGNIHVNAGVLELNHGFAPATIPANLGTIFVGDGEGGPSSDILRNIQSFQVGIMIPFVGPYAWPVVVNESGLWDVNGFSDQTSLLVLHDGGNVATGPNGIIAILIGLAADPGPAPDRNAARISGNVHFAAANFPVAVQEGETEPGDPADLIIDANVFGSGFIKSGTGDLLLSGVNGFSAPLAVNEGELRVGQPDSLGADLSLVAVTGTATLWLQGDVHIGDRPLLLNSRGSTGPLNNNPALQATGTNSWAGDIHLAQDTRVGVGTNGILRLAGAVSGPGGVIKENPGTLTYLGGRTNTYTGLTTVAAGRLLLTKNGGQDHFRGDLVVGDGAGGADADVVEVQGAGLDARDSRLLVNRSGLMLVREDAKFGSIAGDGHLLASAFLTTGRNDLSTEFSGPIDGSGGINKVGDGTLTLTGTNLISALLAFDGRLVLNGLQSNTAVAVFDDAILAGSGRAGAVLATEGTISPGNSPGELQTQDLTIGSAATFRVELTGPAAGTGYDRLTVNGTVTLDDPILDLSAAFIPPVGHVFTIIANDSSEAVRGTFAGLAEGAVIDLGPVRLAVSYRGGAGSNDVTLSALAPPPPCPTPVLSIQKLAGNEVELSWPSCPSNFYQIAWTTNFQRWEMLTPPLAAPEVNDTMTWTAPTSLDYQFFQLIVRPLTNAPVPTNSGIYPGRTFTHDGITRTYRINIPESYTNGMPAPLMLALHGHNQTAQEFAGNIPALSTYANTAGVILVFPDGTADQRGTGWNILDPTPDNPVDDVGFLLALIDELDRSLNIDRKRIYAGGFSNGGQMCHRLAAKTTNVFAAFAAVGSAVAGEFGTGALVYQPPPSQPNSMLIVNATNDCKRPYWGGLNDDGALQPPARDSLTHWTNANFCTPAPVITTNIVVTNHVHRVFADCGGPYPPFNAFKTNQVIREHYQLTCTPGTEVLFVTLTDGGHEWPETIDNVGFDASREVLEFFLRHCRCEATGAMDASAIPAAAVSTN
ncbi:MAG TPA: autotransporter-associated beta strand repeat-containing protein, partial [Verrucomicrobiae bacterium]|nr:autotransporter-associated beta strand repeat-containing protein [Verrucomicrobiae bacterium]